MPRFPALFILFFSCAAFSAVAFAVPEIQSIGFVYPEATDQIRSYNRQREFFQIARPLLSATLLLILLQTGALDNLRNYLQTVTRSSALRVLLFFLSVASILFLANLPAGIYVHYVLEHSMSLSNQSLPAFLTEQVKHFAVQLSMTLFVLPVATILRHQQKYWSISIWVAVAALTFALVFLKPLLIDPLFNQFQNMPEAKSSGLRRSIEDLCVRAELNNPQIFVVDRSKQSKKINAYVTGIAGSTRIVLYDTLLKAVPEDEVLMVVAHEIAHYKFKHIYLGIILSLLGLLPALMAAEFLLAPLIPKFPSTWGIRTKSDPLFLVLLLCIAQFADPLLSPVESGIARYIETEADDYALKLVPAPTTAARLFCHLSQIDMADPSPPAIIEFWLYTHPSIRHRIDRALSK